MRHGKQQFNCAFSNKKKGISRAKQLVLFIKVDDWM
jgi:hypothetical protein